MLSYQHGYHAGCFADVVKHSFLALILDYMVQKEKPLFYLETHAGRGLYDLKAKYALKTQEFKEGIALLWEKRNTLPDVFNPFLTVCEAVNLNAALRYYPGSPEIALHHLRQIDRVFLCELHPQEFAALSDLPKQHKRVHYAHENGLKQLNAQLPPPEKRGLIFIDPSFEMKSEYHDVPIALEKAYQRFPTGVFGLWYPLIEQRFHEQLLRGLFKIKAPVLQVEFYFNQKNKPLRKFAVENEEPNHRAEGEFSKKSNPGMQGCGLWIINPPFVLEKQAEEVLIALTKIFNPGDSHYFIKSYP